jgi:hypothetical protein
MKYETRNDHETREGILKLLSDDETASVSNAETAPRLQDGDEYIDLERIDRGVQKAPGTHTPMGRVLPRKAVHAATWTRIVAQLVTGLEAKAHAAR